MPRKVSAPSSKNARRNGKTADRTVEQTDNTARLRALTMNHDSYPDSYIRGILNTAKPIAMVGASEKDNRPSYFAFKYLLERGYDMIPVNPGQAGHELLGRKIYPRLADIPVPVDMVDIFRAPQYALAIVEE